MPQIKQILSQFLQFIDNGVLLKKPMKWLYLLNAVLPFLIPVGVLVALISNARYDLNADYVGVWTSVVGYVFILLFVAALFIVAYVNFLFWMNRKQRLDTVVRTGDDIVAIPLLANLVQCVGESHAIFVGLVPPVAAALFYLFGLLTGIDRFYSSGKFAWGLALVALVALGAAAAAYIIVLFSHFIAERLRLLPQIANDVRDMGDIHRATAQIDEPAVQADNIAE